MTKSSGWSGYSPLATLDRLYQPKRYVLVQVHGVVTDLEAVRKAGGSNAPASSAVEGSTPPPAPSNGSDPFSFLQQPSDAPTSTSAVEPKSKKGFSGLFQKVKHTTT